MDKGHDKGHKGQMSDREVMKLALEALEDTLALCINYKSVEDADGYVFTEASDVIKQGESAHNALRQALEQPDPVEAAVLAEREACAKVADSIIDKYAFGYYGNEVDTANEIAAAIRERMK